MIWPGTLGILWAISTPDRPKSTNCGRLRRILHAMKPCKPVVAAEHHDCGACTMQLGASTSSHKSSIDNFIFKPVSPRRSSSPPSNRSPVGFEEAPVGTRTHFPRHVFRFQGKFGRYRASSAANGSKLSKIWANPGHLWSCPKVCPNTAELERFRHMFGSDRQNSENLRCPRSVKLVRTM